MYICFPIRTKHAIDIQITWHGWIIKFRYMKIFLMNKLVLFLMLFASLSSHGQFTPPSCVITAPHSNAYFKEGSQVLIRVYSSKLGGSHAGGSVAKVEFFYGDNKLGESTTATSNSFEFLWTSLPAGTHRITAKATDNAGNESVSAGVIITVGAQDVVPVGMSACKGKYVGNIIANTVRSDFNTYWNAVTAENATKWGVLEGTRNVMNWTAADRTYNHAKNNHLVYRYHVLAWGSQYPSWLSGLTPAEFKAEVEQLMALVSQRYPLMDQVEVLNEPMYINTWNREEHAAGTPLFREGLGGSGETGYDWAIWLFEKAREYFPNSKLILNDFELETNQNGVRELLDIIKVLRDRNLIDGFGTQAHTFNVDNTQANTIQNALNLMASSGVPIYVTELDLKGTANPPTDASQLASYQRAFPVYWNHPAVAGITLWGYAQGSMWQANAHLLNSDGTERPAMEWLKTYLSGRPDVGFPCCEVTTDINTVQGSNSLDQLLTLYPNPLNSGPVFVHLDEIPATEVSITVYNPLGQMILNQSFEPAIQFEIDLKQPGTGLYLIRVASNNEVAVRRLLVAE